MVEQDWLSERFAEHQDRLRAMAYRMLGSPSEAEDAVQEAWLRVSRADASAVENLAGWLTTIVARVCLNMLEARRSRPEDPAGIQPPEPAMPGGHRAGPEDETLLADSVGVALLVVLDTLTPAERLAFVLHDVFDVPFGKIVAAFLAASRGGDFGALLALLAPDAVLNADPAAVRMGASAQANGAEAVAGFFAGRAEAARLALVDGVPAAVWAPGGRPRAVFTFTISG